MIISKITSKKNGRTYINFIVSDKQVFKTNSNGYVRISIDKDQPVMVGDIEFSNIGAAMTHVAIELDQEEEESKYGKKEENKETKTK